MAQRALENRLRALPAAITMYNSVSRDTRGESIEDFKFAYQKADAVGDSAVIQGADVGYFKQRKTNKMVISDPMSFATIPIPNPCRWNERKNLCKGFFNIDGIYNGTRYRDFYCGVVGSLKKRKNGRIFVTDFVEGFDSS